MSELVKVFLSTREILFKPQGFKDFSRHLGKEDVEDVQVTVINASKYFSSFQLELAVGDQEQTRGDQWYRVEPNVCSKKPPGDKTVFTITFLKAPVGVYDVTVPIIIRILSVERAELTAEEIVFLKVGWPEKTLYARLPIEKLTVYAGDPCKIPIQVYNLSPSAEDIVVKISKINPVWLESDRGEESEKRIYLDSGESGEIYFVCCPPARWESLRHAYDFLVEVFSDNQRNIVSVIGSIEILPYGRVISKAIIPHMRLPSRWFLFFQDRVNCSFIFENKSNLSISIHLKDIVFSKTIMSTSRRDSLKGNSRLRVNLPKALTLEPGRKNNNQIQLTVERPWFGFPRTEYVEIQPTLKRPGSGDETIDVDKIVVEPTTQRLSLRYSPRIPVYLQLLGFAFILLALGVMTRLLPHHQAPINDLLIISNGDSLISGSSDQTVKRWRIESHLLPWFDSGLGPQRTITQPALGKSVRVLRHSPVEQNSVAIGLEDGQIQIWEISPSRRIRSLFDNNRPDRVFALDFTKDSSLLFSGHGSGRVRVWNLNQKEDMSIDRFDTPNYSPIYSLAVIDLPNESSLLAIGSQLSQLIFWSWERKVSFSIKHNLDFEAVENISFIPFIGKQGHITSLSVAKNASILASSDNFGFITIWDVNSIQKCISNQLAEKRLEQLSYDASRVDSLSKKDQTFSTPIDITQDCTNVILDQWQATPRGQALRAIALTENGCYLSSVGDSGEAILWPLTSDYQRLPEYREGLVLEYHSQAKLNAVDIHRDSVDEDQDRLLIIHDKPGNQIQLHHQTFKNHGCK